MSAVRNNSNRGETRKRRGAPYARGVFGTVIRFFGFGSSEGPEELSETNGNLANGVATDFSSNSRQTGARDTTKSQFTSGNRLPLTPVKSGNASTTQHPASAVPDAELVANYFSQRVGTSITANEVESMVNDLQTTPEPQRFRFTFTTPGRDTSPSFLSPNSNPMSPNATPSRRKLSKNPNGVYRWEGAGSAKQARPRNRYASPAFGASPSKQERLVIKESSSQVETSGQDNKRRRVGEDDSAGAHPPSSDSSAITSLPFPITASPTTPRTNRTNSPSSKPAPPPASRLRTPVKPTAPVVPSPLRQAWSDASSTSSRDDSRKSPSQPAKQTKTANFMAGLIKETTPPHKPDLSNPYQTASPVGKVGPPRRANRRPRATGRPAAPSKEQKEAEEKQKAEEEKKKEDEKLKEYSTQAKIEATVPKGSKRSRPPARFETKDVTFDSGSSHSEVLTSTENNKVAYVVEEVTDEDEEVKRSAKRSKPSIGGRGFPSSAVKPSLPISDVTVEEVDDVEMQAPAKDKGKEKVAEPLKTSDSATLQPTNNASNAASRSSFGFKPSSIPKEPSKLRFSIQAENSTSALTTPGSVPPSSTTPAPSPPSIQTVSSGFSFSFKPAPVTTTSAVNEHAPTGKDEVMQEVKPSTSSSVDDIKLRVSAMDVKLLPVFVITASATTVHPNTPEHIKARKAATDVPASSLPKFDLQSANTFSFNYDPSNPKPAAASSIHSLPTKPSPPKFNPFVINGSAPAAGPPSLINFGAGSSSKASTATFSPSVPSPPITGFDFAAAGMKAPAAKKDAWNCALCGLSNPQTAAKCTTCDEPAPGGTSASGTSKAAAPSFSLPTPPVMGFDFAAAGIKPPSVPKDTWNCGLCGLSNAKSASKCTTCDEPAPGGASSSTAPSAPSLFGGFKPPPVKGFDFAAAGMKPPTSVGTWSCSLCGLSNPAAASMCETCETPK